MDKIIRVAHFPGALSGGVGSVVVNLFKNIDRDKIKFDFYVSYGDNYSLEREVEDLGGRIFRIPQIREIGIFSYYRIIKEILINNGPYDAVHIHSIHVGAISALSAKSAKIKRIIYHVHNTKDPALKSWPKRFLLAPLFRTVIKKTATVKLACGYDAGCFIYGKSKFYIFNNGIDLYKFSVQTEKICFNKDKDGIIVGTIGRVCDIKNQQFLLDLAVLDKKKKNKILFLIVGDGPLLNYLKTKSIELGIEEKILFLGMRTDTPALYNSMDVFVLPSLHEGFPVSVVEAQACGLPCITSDQVTSDANLGISCYSRRPFVAEIWLDDIYNFTGHRETDAERIRIALSSQGYNIKDNAMHIMDIYSASAL